MRSSKNKEYNVDETRYNYYNDEICILFIESIRQLNHCDYSHESNMSQK